MTTAQEAAERLRLLEQDHAPDGWPAVQMRDISALLAERAELLARVEAEERALQWVEQKARAGKLEIAPSPYGTGFVFCFWAPRMIDAKVFRGNTMAEAIDAARAAQEKANG